MNFQKLLLWLLTLAFAASMLVTTGSNGPDFTVYWKAAHRFWEGGVIYSPELDGVMTFKYPPWILPVFLPFGLFPLNLAKWLWGGVEALSLVYLVSWLRSRVTPWVMSLCLLTFSGIWTVHAFDGQISLPLVAVALWAFPVFHARVRGTPINARLAGASYFLSAKLFTAFPLLGLRWQRGDGSRMIKFLGILGLLSLPAWWAHHKSFTELMQSYSLATAPGFDSLGRLVISVKGSQAQGWVSLIFRLMGWDAANQRLVLGASVGLAGTCALLWRGCSRNLPAETQWVGWLALTATLQPLAGFHTFVFAFPLSCISMDRWVRERNTLYFGLNWFAVLLIAATTQKLFDEIGYFLQLASIKSIGILFCLVFSLIAARQG